MNVKIEQEFNFVVDNSQLFLDAQEAKKVSERTVVQWIQLYLGREFQLALIATGFMYGSWTE